MYDVVIIGAGASGLMCALNAKLNNKNLNILILERNNKIGKKLLITGNGRCNLGNKNITLNNYNSDDLLRFKDVLESNMYLNTLEDIGLIIKEELYLGSDFGSGRLYPYSMQASTICKAFNKKLSSLGVDIKCDYEVISIYKEDDIFIINNEIKSKKVVISTGGKSYINFKANKTGYDILKEFGHTITPLYPSLTSLKTNYKYIKNIKGVRFDGTVSLIIDNKLVKEERGQIQFTSDTISGICIFNLSRSVGRSLKDKSKVVISVDFMPEHDFSDIKKHLLLFKNSNVIDILSDILNIKLAEVIVKELNLFDKKVDNLNDKQLVSIINKIKNFKFNIIDTGDFNSAQVTTGGACLKEFDNNLESKIIKNLYATGEVLDVDGNCGGYNLAWAFTSAIIVAKNVAKDKN